MNRFVRRVWLALRQNSAATHPASEDARLRGRTYAIPFDTVWQVATQLADGGLPRWRMHSADDREGVIVAEAARLFPRGWVDDVVIRISLDANAQTRVDARSAARNRWADLGANARRLGKLFRTMDRELARLRTARPPFRPASAAG